MRLQSIIFPTEEKHQAARKLFYRGSHGIINSTRQSLSMGYAGHFDFATYFNACSWAKIKEYSNAKSLTLTLSFKGKIRVTYLGYTKNALVINRHIFAETDYSSKTRKSVSYTFPDNSEHMIGFEITALEEKSELFGGEFSVDVAKKDLQKVTLSIATTTCRKEEFIKKNVKLIQDQILRHRDEIAKNIYLHVVDNGRTLKRKDVSGPHTFLHLNPNVGGSGGFARGMLETLAQKPAATHVLLMDDDVLVLPESIRRTYVLLQILKPKYRDHFISGAMLYYERPGIQHEDIGTVIDAPEGWNYRPLKKQFDHEKLKNNLDNEYNYPPVANSYSAWWYCCIPVKVIRKNGLPLPLFVRCDDSEYGLRCSAGLLTLNGICIWHLGFVTKYNPAFDFYQNHRNMLVAQATSGILPDIDMIRLTRTIYRREVIQFNYGAAELVIRALEDYLRGPDFLKTPRGEQIVQENFKLCDQLLPLTEVPGAEKVNKLDAYLDPSFTIRDRFIAKYTLNGHRFCPKFLEDPRPVATSFDSSVQLHRIILRTHLVAINPYDSTGITRVKDRDRFKKLHRRYKKALRAYRRHGRDVAAAYRANYDYFTSEEFWHKYLGY